MKRIMGTLAAAAVCLSLAGCGDDAKDAKADDEPTTSADTSSAPASEEASETAAATLSRAELIAEGDAICQASDDRVEAAASTLQDEAEILAFYVDTFVPEVEGQIRDLRALDPAAEDAAAYAEILDTLEAELAEAKADPETAIADPNSLAEATRLAKEFGFQVCGQD